MLLGYGARNCWCFKEWLDIDLRFSGYVPNEISNNKDFSLIMGFEGANASGKTNALKVFAFIANFATLSFDYSPEAKFLYDSYFNNNESSEFYVEFKTKDLAEYKYEFELQNNCIKKETLYLVNNTLESIIFHREGNTCIKNELYNKKSVIIFRNNASFISTLHQYGITEIDQIYDFFYKCIINVTYNGLRYEIKRDIPNISEIYYSTPEALTFTKTLLKKFDTGISDVKISYREDEKDNKIYFPIFSHDTENEIRTLGIDSESKGTKALYINLLYYYITIKSGGVLLLDEFDINLHSDILPHLIKIFSDPDINTTSAQILFTSLNPDILDILGKYRTYLFVKENGEAFCYRLDEPETNILRNDRPVSVPYRRHQLGGYPKIEA